MKRHGVLDWDFFFEKPLFNDGVYGSYYSTENAGDHQIKLRIETINVKRKRINIKR